MEMRIGGNAGPQPGEKSAFSLSRLQQTVSPLRGSTALKASRQHVGIVITSALDLGARNLLFGRKDKKQIPRPPGRARDDRG